MELSQQEIEPVIREVIRIFLIPKFNSYEMKATGEWEREIQARGNAIWGTKYTEQLVYGRKPGKFPPKEPIVRWAMAKFGVSRAEAERIQYPIRKKIADEGTEWHKQGGTDLLNVLSSTEVSEYITKRLTEILGQRAKIELLRYTQLAFK